MYIYPHSQTHKNQEIQIHMHIYIIYYSGQIVLFVIMFEST